MMSRPHSSGARVSMALAFITTTFPAFHEARAESFDSPQVAAPAAIEDIVVTAKRLDDARNGIQNQTGASTYTITAADIAAQPGGDNTLLNQVILRAPDVAQDSFGQLHVRGEHNGLQYRLNGIILPEGLSVFGQSLDARLISSVKLITGALPAEYGLRTAGIIDLHTKSGSFTPGGSISIYGGSHGTIAPSVAYGGSAGTFNYFVSADYLRNTLGIESPDGSSNPLHDTTQQAHGFAYIEDIVSPSNRVSAVFGTSHGTFQIPNQYGLQPSLGLTVNGQTTFPSQNLAENQREITHYGILGFQHSDGDLDLQTSLIARYSSLNFSPDQIGDLLYNGIAQSAYKRDVALAWQTDGAYHVGDAHIIRAGFYLQRDRAISNTTSQVLPVDANGNQVGDSPLSIVDNGRKTGWLGGVYVQDEWQILPTVTVNYGLRFDKVDAYDKEQQLSPRVNLVWHPADKITVHAGYARYFSPPPFELVGAESVALFQGTTAASSVTQNNTPKAERANYIDVGVEQKLFDALTLGVDTYYKKSRNLIDEGQFGAPIIQTPFNYRDGKQYGMEFTAAYDKGAFSAYANLALQHALGRDIVSSQFNFDPADLAYISNHYIDLDHEQHVSVSGGVSYLWRGTQLSADVLLASGLRATSDAPRAAPNGIHLPYYTQVNLGASHAFDLASAGSLTLRFDIINLFDKKYEIRDGSGVGVGAPQYGARRGFFVGLSKAL